MLDQQTRALYEELLQGEQRMLTWPELGPRTRDGIQRSIQWLRDKLEDHHV